MANYLIRSGDTLGQIAQANQTDIATLQKLNPQITNPNLIIAGQNLNLPTAPIAPTIPAVQSTPTIQSIQQGLNDVLKGLGGTLNPQTGQIDITAEQLTATTQPKAIDVTPPPSTLGTSASAMVAGATADSTALQKYIDLMTPKETPESKQYKDLMTQIQGELPSVTGRGTAQLAAEQAQGVPEKIQALTEVQNQINTKIAEFKKVEADYLKAVQATEQVPGTTTGIVAGQQREIQKALNIERVAQAAEIGILQAQASAMQGNLTLAQSQANRAVDLKYSDIQDELNIRLQQLKLIEPELTKQEKIRADATTSYLNQQKDLINQQQAQEKQLTNYNLSAMRDYPSANISINDSYQTTQNKILGSREYQATIKTTPTPTPGIQGQPTPEQPIISLTGKPLTDTQSTSLGYAQRMNDANKIITDLGSKFTGVLNYISGSTFFPNILKSEDRQNYEQAQRNFINSVLRKESGAAISPSEFDSAAKQYFPQPGDSQAVIDQKTANRTRSINNLLQSANVSQSVLGGGTTGDYESYLKAIGE